MKILTNLSEVKTEFPGAHLGITIGNFDGVHRGHRQLLEKIRGECVERGLLFVVITFVPHPQKILQPNKQRFLINSYQLRRELLSGLGVDLLVELPFTRDFSTLGAEEFLERHLLSVPGIKKFFLGYDFAFGTNKQGGHDMMKGHCQKQDIDVEVQPKFEVFDAVVSSSMIRDLIAEGNLSAVEAVLQRPFQLQGVVVKGEGRGKRIGFPTANIHVSEDLIVPRQGVYVSRTIYRNMAYKSVTNIGKNPTFKVRESLNIETNIFDFDLDIYGEQIEIQFLKRIRDERKFPTVNDLIEQIRSDVEVAKASFSE